MLINKLFEDMKYNQGIYFELIIKRSRVIWTDKYNPCNHRNYQNERIYDNNYKYRKSLSFLIPTMQLRLINLSGTN